MRSSSLHFRGVPIKAMAETDTIAASKIASSSSVPGTFQFHHLFSFVFSIVLFRGFVCLFFTPLRIAKKNIFLSNGVIYTIPHLWLQMEWIAFVSLFSDLKWWLYFSLNAVFLFFIA